MNVENNTNIAQDKLHGQTDQLPVREKRSGSDQSSTQRKPLRYGTFHARDFSLARPFLGSVKKVELEANEVTSDRLQRLFFDCPGTSSITIKTLPGEQVVRTFYANLGDNRQVKEITFDVEEVLLQPLRALQLDSKSDRVSSSNDILPGSGESVLGLLAPSAPSSSSILFAPRQQLLTQLQVLPENVCLILRQQLVTGSQDMNAAKTTIRQELLEFRKRLNLMLRSDDRPAQFKHQNGQVDTRSISKKISDFETFFPTMVKNWKEKQLGWKEYMAKIKIVDDPELVTSELMQTPRKLAIAMVGEIADILALRSGIPHCTFQDVGTNSVKSDVDYSAVCQSTKFWSNAVQGEKAAYANIIWWTLFEGPVAHHADCNYYGPHIGKYFTDELQNPLAREIFAYASLMGSLIQLHAHTHQNEKAKEKARAYIQTLKFNLQDLSNSSFPGDKERSELTLKAIDACLEDVRLLEESVENMRKVCPKEIEEDIVADFLLVTFTKLLADIAQKIDAESNKDQKEILIAQYYYYTVLRERYLSDGFCTKGAFDVVCNNIGSQAFLVFQSKLEARQVDVSFEFQQQVFRGSSPQDYLDCMAENSAFAAGKENYLGFAKSIVRAAQSACELMQSMLQQSKNALESARERLAHQGAQADDQHIPNLEKRVKRLQQQVSDGNSLLRSMELLLALKKQEFDKLSFTDLFWKKFDELEYARYVEARKQLLALEPSFYTHQRTLEECFDYFAQESQKHFKLDVAGKKRYFHTKALRSHPNAKLQELVHYYETFRPDDDKKKKASLKVEGLAHAATRMKQQGRRKLWPRLMEQFDYEFQTKRKENIQALKDLAERIYEESTKGEKNFKPVHEQRLSRIDLLKLLSDIYCGDISRIKRVNELMQLAESVEKTGRIFSDSGTIQLVLQELAEKEILKLKKFFLNDKKPETISEEELLGRLKDHFLTEHAVIKALAFATGFVPTPQKPEKLPPYVTALCNPSQVRDYFNNPGLLPKAFQANRAAVTGDRVDMYGFDIKSQDKRDVLESQPQHAEPLSDGTLSSLQIVVLPGESDDASDADFLTSSPLPSPHASPERSPQTSPKISPHSSPVRGLRMLLSTGRQRSSTGDNTDQPGKYLSVRPTRDSLSLSPPFPSKLERRRTLDPSQAASFFDKAKARVHSAQKLQSSLPRMLSTPSSSSSQSQLRSASPLPNANTEDEVDKKE